MSRQNASFDDEPRDSELSRLYRESAQGEPPARLDRAILDAARRDLERREPRARTPWWRGWLAPVSLFATVVVTSTLTLLVHEEREREAAKPVSARPAASTPQPVPATSPATPSPQQAAPSAPIDRASAAYGSSSSASDRSAAPERVDTRTRSSAPIQDKASAREAERRRVQEHSPATEAPADRRRDEPKPPALQRPLPPEAFPGLAKPESAAPTAPGATEGRESHQAEKQELRKAFPAGPELRQPASPAENSRLPALRSAPLKEKGESGMPAGGGEGIAPAAPRVEPSGKLKQGQRSPEAWIEEIRELRRQGRQSEALAALEQLRRAFPDFALPEDLR